MMLAIATLACCIVGCAKKEEAAEEGGIKNFTMFIAMPGSELNDGNAVQEVLAEKYGARIKETWITGQTPEEAVGAMVAANDYPDFIEGSDGYQMLVDAGALVALDEVWDNYPNIKNYLSESDWNKCRKADGHIYAMPQFGIVWDKDTTLTIGGEAWWIQVRALKYAGWPKIVTMDDYFDVIEKYADYINNECGGVDSYGNPVIPYTILCDGWRYFCLENAPFFLDGYPNDGCCIVDKKTHKVIDYNTTPTAEKYFRKLNEEYLKGYVDPEFATQNYDEYIAKLSNGQVIGMIDQYWDFGYTVEPLYQTNNMNDCLFVPVGVVADAGTEEHYRNKDAIDVSGGFSITTACKDLDAALQFVNDMLEPEALTLRFWGIEGKDYIKGADGVFTRTQEMRDNAADATYKADNLCQYSYLPQYTGMDHDGINAYAPGNQPSEYYEGLKPEYKECLDAYGVETQADLLNQPGDNEAWFPLWSWSNDLQPEMDGGEAWAKMADIKHEYLPQVVLAGGKQATYKDFDEAWAAYQEVYKTAKPEEFLAAAEAEVQKRIDMAAGK
jgi:putative aldouronate transport system substrate-binding protein